MNKKYIIGINEGDYGSTGTIALNILTESRSIGMTPLFAVYEANDACDFEIKITAGPLNDFGNRILCRIDGSDGFHNVTATRRFLDKIKDLEVAIIHLHNIHGRYVNLPLIFEFARAKNARIIWTLHDCWAFTGRCAHFELANCQKWRHCCGHCPTRREYPASYLLDRTRKYLEKKISLYQKYSDLLTMVCPSYWLYKHFLASRANFLECAVIHNGVIPPPKNAPFHPKRHIEKGNRKVFLAIAAGFDKRKGFDFINKLANELDPHKYMFIVVGMRKKKGAISKNIINVGYIKDRAEIDYYYSISDALINPTLEDTFPTVNIEALSHGIPVITFDTGGSPESINDKCGIVVPKGSYESLKKAIETFEKNKYPKKSCLLRSNLFSTARMNNEYMELFRRKIR